MSSADFTIYTPSVETLSYSLISSGENSAHFLQLMPFTILQFTFHQSVTSGTHHCWVGRDSVEWEVSPTLLHKTSSGNQTQDLLILSPTAYPLGHPLTKVSNEVKCSIFLCTVKIHFPKLP